ncbi:hypothetical protein BT96DRAFT_999145 [Gymnopus androsaceus JB14]|uniref:Uncharacterized protein n=1 Tax=Gymnopus androsaceus JB14 TaxID=1447944 RepID=A0A6A4H7W2_9AGAR|nr:hypothetical protein BT96DRAFT_999145 [Gymnopus androsaceus JB14]
MSFFQYDINSLYQQNALSISFDYPNLFEPSHITTTEAAVTLGREQLFQYATIVLKNHGLGREDLDTCLEALIGSDGALSRVTSNEAHSFFALLGSLNCEVSDLDKLCEKLVAGMLQGSSNGEIRVEARKPLKTFTNMIEVIKSNLGEETYKQAMPKFVPSRSAHCRHHYRNRRSIREPEVTIMFPIPFADPPAPRLRSPPATIASAAALVKTEATTPPPLFASDAPAIIENIQPSVSYDSNTSSDTTLLSSITVASADNTATMTTTTTTTMTTKTTATTIITTRSIRTPSSN